jgi:hypothetical protein
MNMTIDIQLASRSLLLRIGQLGSRLARQRAMAKGGRSFWQEIADSIQVHEEGQTVSIGATHVAARIKHFGGRVSAPGRGAGSLHRRALAIPIGIARTNRWDTDAAQQAGYELFSDTTDNGVRILFGRSTRHRRAHQREPLFVLRKAAQIPADPYWLTEADLQRLTREAMQMEGWFDA